MNLYRSNPLEDILLVPTRMEIEYNTTVTASKEFWIKLISEKITSGFQKKLIGEEAGFTITSVDKPALEDIADLSFDFPDELFTAVVTTDNIYKNVIEYYEFLDGATYFNHLEPNYFFSLSKEVKRSVDPLIIDEFKKEISEALDRVAVFTPSYENVNGIQRPKKEMVTNILFEYGNQNINLSAKVIGQTWIEIDLNSISKIKNNWIKKSKNMSAVFQTIVTVPKDFIEKELEKILDWNLGLSAKLENNRFIFWTKNYPNPGLEQIINYSEKHRNLVFETESTCEMEPDVADIYTISNGEIISQQKITWFNFIYESELKSQLADDVVLLFEEKARDYFNMIDNHLRRKYGQGCFHEIHVPKFNSMEFYYSTDIAILIARRKDLKTLEVEIEFTNLEESDLTNEDMDISK
jgi:hypothetical protein